MRIYCAAVVLGDTDQSFVIVFIKLQGLLLSVIYIGADDLRNRQLFLYYFRRNLLRIGFSVRIGNCNRRFIDADVLSDRQFHIKCLALF